MIRVLKLIASSYIIQREFYEEPFAKDYRYLGKSKAIKEQLFEVENEE